MVGEQQGQEGEAQSAGLRNYRPKQGAHLLECVLGEGRYEKILFMTLSE